MQLSFHVKDSSGLKVCSGTKSSLEAHAHLRCVYFPVVQGKESIEVILEKLEADGYGITENFETVRRLGRLLPEARWSWLPFMEPKIRKSDRAEVLKRCCFRVKCFIDTDVGFNPTPSKALPQDVDAGHEPPEEITAVIRPASFTSATASENLYQKYIMKENFAMTLEIKFKDDENVKEQHIYSGQLNPSSLKGFHGLYMFSLKKKSPKPFQTAGIYLFRFSLIESCPICFKEVRVKALSETTSWELVSDGKSTHGVRAGSCFPEVFSVTCRDRFCNRIPFKPQTEIEMKLNSGGRAISSECNYDQYIPECSYDQYITHDKYTMKFKKLGDDICRYGLCIRQCDANVASLNIKQSNIELEMSNLGACIGLDSFHDLVYDKDMIMEKIEGKADSAAAVIYKLLRSPKPEQLYLEYAHDILGVVALLGEVRTHKLSSMLSTYLGEDQMLAVVCKSRAAARALEINQMDGNVNCASVLDILAAKLGISIKGLYVVIILEDIQPYKQGVSSDPQRELAIPQPTLSNRETPPGFLGYAVNMIFLPEEYLQFRTASGHGLRETLFYHLLGKLQVYKSSEHLYMASSCIEDGAVSLDGGMMRGNGVVSASAGSEDPYILFPVICLERQLLLSPEKVERLKRIEELKLEQNQLQDRIQEELRNGAKYKKKLAKKLMDKKQIDDQFENALLRVVPEAPLMHDPSLNQGGQISSFTFAGNRDIMQNRTAEAVICHSKKLEDAIKETGLQIKHHDDNIKFLEGQKNRLDDSILDLEAALAKTYSASGTDSENKESFNGQNEEETIEQIFSFDKSAAAICVQLQKRTGAQITNIPFMKDIIGIVALLGKVDDDNLSRTLSDYLGQESMLAVVCKTRDGLKALETYDKEGLIIKSSGLHGVGASIGRPLDDRYLVICLENLRPYTGEFIADDPQRRLSIKKPRYVNGETLPGFLGFAVNMINIDTDNLYCVTSTGHGLRETLFYGLFSQLQVYKTRAEMMQALPFIADGAISLDGGIIKSGGLFSLGKREVQIKFPKSCGRSYLPESYFKTEIRMKELKWERVRCVEDLEREQTLLTNAKNNFEIRKEEFVKFLSQSSSYL